MRRANPALLWNVLFLSISFLLFHYFWYQNEFLSHKIFKPYTLLFQEKEVMSLTEEYELKMKQWKKRTKSYCEVYSDQLILKYEYNKHHMKLNKEANLAYCFIAKSGTSTNFRIWFDMLNLTKRYVNTRAIKMFRTSSRISDNQLVLKYTMVRHPFVRLMSGYIDMIAVWQTKMLNINRNKIPNYDKWKDLLNLINFNASTMVTPWEYLVYIVHENERCRASNKPLICLSGINMHYVPYYVSCSPCALNFDFIVKLETFKKDFKYIVTKVAEIFATQNNQHISENDHLAISGRTLKQKWILKILNDSIEGPKSNAKKGNTISTVEFTKRVFSLLSNNLKRRLREAYFFDFLFFEYDQFEFT